MRSTYDTALRNMVEPAASGSAANPGKKREADVRDDVGHERYGGRALCAGCRTRDIEDAFTDEAGRRLLSRAAVSEMTGVRVVHDPRPANEIARRGAILAVHRSEGEEPAS
jgi:hypothetical protein